MLKNLISPLFSLCLTWSLVQPAKAFAEESVCEYESANYVLSFGSGFGTAKCKDGSWGLLIMDKNLSEARDGVLLLIGTSNKRLKSFWTLLYSGGQGTPYYTELLELGRSYFKNPNQETIQALQEYVEAVKVKLSTQQPAQSKTIKCESIDQKYNSCDMGIDLTEVLDAKVSLSEVHSRAKCIEGESFQQWGTEIIVEKGCRATFTVNY